MKNVSCGAVVWRQTNSGFEILLIKQFRNRDSWGIPKGHLKEGETFEQCAVREVFEETGVTVVLETRLSDVQMTNAEFEKTVVSFTAWPAGSGQTDTSHPDCEVAEAAWWDILDLPTIHYYQRPLITNVVSRLNEFAAQRNS